eukprot:gene34084-biopygen10978
MRPRTRATVGAGRAARAVAVMSKHVIVGGGTVDAVEIACPMRATGGKEIPAVAVPPGEPEHNKVAPAGAGESLVAALGSALVEATEPVPAMEMKIEELEAFEDVTRCWMDARAPFGNRALPEIFMRWTRAIVAWMHARGVPTVGYLHDFFCVADTKEKAEEAMLLLVKFVTFRGFKVNNAKCEGPTQVLQFLGVLLNTEGDVCTACIDEERIAIVVKHAGELRAQAARGMVARRALESLLGVLAFCNQVVWGLSLYTKRGFAFLAATTHWNGRMVVVNIDNKSAMYQVGNWWGPVEYLLLLPQIFLVCVKHDIRLQTKYINTKDNLLADLLSRLDMGRFMVEHRIFSRATIRHQDRDGRMLCPVRWAELDHEFGPFMVDSCMAESKANSYCHLSWSKWGTACCFLVPVWDGKEGWELVRCLPYVFNVVREWAKGTHLFTAPDLRGFGRTAWGPTRTLCIFITFYSWLVEPETIKCWGKPPRPVMPLTLADLAKMALLISAWGLGQEALWAAILVGFFGLFQKDNLTTGKTGAWNTRGALVRDDVLFLEDGGVAVQGSLLCPVRAVRRFMERTAGRPEDSVLFVMEKLTGRRASVVPLTHDALVAGIKALAERLGLDPASYARHSLQRGGATTAMRLDVNNIYIKMQGDWKSDCFKRYCELDTEQKLILPGAMAAAATALL